MPIEALPESAIRSLGSGQALTDPVSLIKELIDNSLDAQATKITVDVSPNLLDVIQVSDNGYGIRSEDRESACLRHTTSKIRSYDDIATCGTLGFRGEALSSAATLSQAMSFITKVDGEKVAVECEVNKNGSLKSSKNSRGGVGTIIKVTGFLKTFPVRRQTAEKSATANLKRAKKLIATYYLSHPKCRFEIRVLSPKGRVSDSEPPKTVYAPAKDVTGGVQNVIGAKNAAALQWVSIVDSPSDIKIEACLPKPGSDLNKVSSPTCTQYIYVDSRPVSIARGTFKTIFSRYRSYLKAAFSIRSIPDPFIYLNIICPKNTYDPNIEPAKDDVLFENVQAVEDAIESVFKEVYGDLLASDEAAVNTEESASQTKSKRQSGGVDFDVLLARRKEPETEPVILAPEVEPIEIENEQPMVEKPMVEEPTVEEPDNLLAPIETNPVTNTIQHASEKQTEEAEDEISLELSQYFPTRRSPLARKVVKEKEVERRPIRDRNQIESEDDLFLPEPLQESNNMIDKPIEQASPLRRASQSGLNELSLRTHFEDNLPPAPPPPLPEDEEQLFSEEAERARLENEEENRRKLIREAEEEDEAMRKDPKVFNPWTAAKMAGSFKSPVYSSRNHPPPGPSDSPSMQRLSTLRRRPEQNSDTIDDGDYINAPARNTNRTPRPSRRSFGDSTAFPSPPHSSPSKRPQGIQRSVMSGDPDNAGAIDSFVIRTPRTGVKPTERRPSISKPKNTEKHGSESGGYTDYTSLPPPPPYCSQPQSPVVPSVPAAGRGARKGGFITAASLLEGDIQNGGLFTDEPAVRHRKRQRVACEEDEDEEDLYSQPPPPRKNKQNPNQNRQNKAAATLSQASGRAAINTQEPRIYDDVPALRPRPPGCNKPEKRKRTRSLLPLDKVPEPDDQAISLVKTVDVPGKSETIKEMYSVIIKPSDEDFCLETIDPHDLGTVVMAWAERLGAEQENPRWWTVRPGMDGWNVLEPKIMMLG